MTRTAAVGPAAVIDSAMGIASMTAASAVRTTLRSRLVAIVAALLLVAGVGVGAAALAPTQSAWTDASFGTAAVTSGDWDAPPPATTYGCVAMNADGTVMKGGTCKVTSLVYDEWGDNSQHSRNYYVGVDSNAGNGYVRLTLDLSAGTLRNNTGVGTWKWNNAATTGGEITPTSACSALPTLVADSPTMWQTSRSFYFSVVDKRPNGSVTCK